MVRVKTFVSFSLFITFFCSVSLTGEQFLSVYLSAFVDFRQNQRIGPKSNPSLNFHRIFLIFKKMGVFATLKNRVY